ncbi:MAG: hypothetical protein HY925_07260 [Elusimicrobia bacterium]|nr:hypothetical protein [Elusimicrobiota bacterium]
MAPCKKVFSIPCLAVLISHLAFLSVRAHAEQGLLLERAKHTVASIHSDGLYGADSILGSGVLVGTQKWIYLVTAKHVIISDSGLLSQIRARFRPISNVSSLAENLYLDLAVSSATGNLLLSERDVVAIRLGRMGQTDWEFVKGVKIGTELPKRLPSLINQETIAVEKRACITFEEVTETQEAIYFGFPASLNAYPELKRRKYDLNFPLYRRSMVAGKDRQSQILLLDGMVQPGNSGGPVYVLQQAKDIVVSPDRGPQDKEARLAGIIVESVPYLSTINSGGQVAGINIDNAGYAVVEPIDAVLSLLANEK